MYVAKCNNGKVEMYSCHGVNAFYYSVHCSSGYAVNFFLKKPLSEWKQILTKISVVLTTLSTIEL